MGDNHQMIYKRRLPVWLGSGCKSNDKNVLQSKQPRRVKNFSFFKRSRSRIHTSWIIYLSEVVASSFSKFGHTNRTIFSTAEAISINEVFKYPFPESPRFCIYFSGFTTFIALKSSLIMWSAVPSYNRSWRLNSSPRMPRHIQDRSQ